MESDAPQQRTLEVSSRWSYDANVVAVTVLQHKAKKCGERMMPPRSNHHCLKATYQGLSAPTKLREMCIYVKNIHRQTDQTSVCAVCASCFRIHPSSASKYCILFCLATNCMPSFDNLACTVLEVDTRRLVAGSSHNKSTKLVRNCLIYKSNGYHAESSISSPSHIGDR